MLRPAAASPRITHGDHFSSNWRSDHCGRGRNLFLGHRQFATDGRLANLLKLLVVLVCLGAIVQRLLVLTY